jgi:hypothetical protein
MRDARRPRCRDLIRVGACTRSQRDRRDSLCPEGAVSEPGFAVPAGYRFCLVLTGEKNEAKLTYRGDDFGYSDGWVGHE